MKQPIIISFYTDDWRYPEHAERLADECDSFGLGHYIVEKASTRNYIRNTALKPFFIKECLEKFKSPVTWIDVDALILKTFELDISDADILACEHNNRTWAVAFMSFNYTPAALGFLTSWCDATAAGTTDEAALEHAWQTQKNDVIIKPLPKTYHFVKWSGKLIVPADTIICHQLSTWEDKIKRKHNGRLNEDA